MKGLTILTIFTFLMIISCEKETVTPNYVEVQEETPNIQPWDLNYHNGGTLPSGTSTQQNKLSGTRWVLYKLYKSNQGNSIEYPNDTIDFIDNTHYTVNNSAVRVYQLYPINGSNNLNLNLYSFYPFGGSNYGGQIGQYFYVDGIINGVGFNDIQNTNNNVTNIAWLNKI